MSEFRERGYRGAWPAEGIAWNERRRDPDERDDACGGEIGLRGREEKDSLCVLVGRAEVCVARRC